MRHYGSSTWERKVTQGGRTDDSNPGKQMHASSKSQPGEKRYIYGVYIAMDICWDITLQGVNGRASNNWAEYAKAITNLGQCANIHLLCGMSQTGGDKSSKVSWMMMCSLPQ